MVASFLKPKALNISIIFRKIKYVLMSDNATDVQKRNKTKVLAIVKFSCRFFCDDIVLHLKYLSISKIIFTYFSIKNIEEQINKKKYICVYFFKHEKMWMQKMNPFSQISRISKRKKYFIPFFDSNNIGMLKMQGKVFIKIMHSS